MTDTQQNDAQAEARAAIENDEIALRIRALGVAIVTVISTMDKKSKRQEARDASDPLFLIMEASLDVFDMTLRDVRRQAEAMESIAKSLDKLANAPVYISESDVIDLAKDVSGQLSEQG